MVKIKDKFKFLPKSSLPAKIGKEIGFFPFFTSSSNQNKFVDEYLYEGESIIIGSGGSPSIHFQAEKFAVSTDCYAIQSESGDYSIKLLYYYLYGNIHILHQGFKGAGLKHISRNYIENIEIPEYDINTQVHLVAQLDLIQSLLDNRNSSMKLLDQLVSAFFLNLFWKNGKQNKQWKELEIKDVLIKNKGSRTGPFGSNLKHSEFKDTGDVAVLGIDNAVNNVFQWSEKRYITLRKYEELKNYTIKPRDVIITIMGTVGRSAVIPDDIPLSINTKHLAALTLDEKECNPYYLAQAIHTDPFISFQLKTKSRGAVMDGLNLNIIRKTKFRNPPIDLQIKFEVWYKNIYKRKSNLNKSFKLLEELFKSFIHLILSEKGMDINNLTKKYLDDVLLQQDLLGKINTQDFQGIEDYRNAKKLLFQLLETGNSRISQTNNKRRKAIKIQIV